MQQLQKNYSQAHTNIKHLFTLPKIYVVVCVCLYLHATLEYYAYDSISKM